MPQLRWEYTRAVARQSPGVVAVTTKPITSTPKPTRGTLTASSGSTTRRYASRTEEALALIRALIKDQELGSGDRLPSESELAESLAISRSSVREAFKLLEQEGVATAIQGKGRFISASAALNLERPVTKYESTTEMLESLGFEVSTVVLDVRERAATPAEAKALELAAGESVISIQRLRCGDDEPMVFSTDAVPRRLLPGPIEFRDWSVSVTSMLQAHGSKIETSLARITAAMLPDDYATRYKLARFDPWILVEETCLTMEGVRALYALDYHRGDKLAFNVLRRR